MNAVLSARGVSRRYRTYSFTGFSTPKTVLDDVSLDIGEGESVALLGRSGSGKSTLGRLLLGLERPDAGTVLFRGADLRAMDRAQTRSFRQQVQVVFQDCVSAVDPRCTVGRIISEPLRHLTELGSAARAGKVEELLVKVGLSARDADKLPVQMSGGQLQRVCIARALAPNPRLIVLDEAVSNLDLVLQMQMIGLLKSLKRDFGTAFLFITHDLRLVRLLCERVLVLADGCLQEEAEVGGATTFVSAEGLALQRAILPALPLGS